MGGFFASLFSEINARRRRLRGALGELGQGIVEFLIMGGILVGSVGLFVRPHYMPAAAPWGFALPFVFIAGYLLIDARRQASLARGVDAAKVTSGSDWVALLWSFGCALVGLAAFVVAWTAEPEAPVDPLDWTPPEHALEVDIPS
ncbi:hypothetical protein [Terricaulis sp.]|jgi:hypothetical protein|uniref:hypothetical protein n=1 Tax=Terricaulis sp. TaxID=2768686 RepID=UPI002AC77F5A|nr:hypothetical protein [Terricaulis sp.]MDZ4691767.1 hypothetical protein [Terricaulis sp.]